MKLSIPAFNNSLMKGLNEDELNNCTEIIKKAQKNDELKAEALKSILLTV